MTHAIGILRPQHWQIFALLILTVVLISVAAAMSGSVPKVHASTEIIDFDDRAAGVITGTEYSSQGVEFSIVFLPEFGPGGQAGDQGGIGIQAEDLDTMVSTASSP